MRRAREEWEREKHLPLCKREKELFYEFAEECLRRCDSVAHTRTFARRFVSLRVFKIPCND